MDIKLYLQVIRRWLWLIVLMTIIGAGVSYVLVQRQPNAYQTQVKLLVGPTINDTESVSTAQRGAPQVIQTYANLVTTRGVLEAVINDLHLSIGPNALAGMITVTPNPDAQVLTIAVRANDPKQAIAIANGLGSELVKLYSNRPTNSTSTSEVSGQAVQLQKQIEQSQARISQLEADLKTTSDMQNNPAVVAQQKKIADLEAQLATIPDATLTKEMQDHETRITQLEASLKGTLAVDARRLILDQLSREDNLLAGLKSQINDQKRLLLDQLGQERNRLNNLQTAAIQQQNQILNQLATEHTQLATTQRTLEALSPSLQKGLSRQITVIDPATNAPLQTGNTLLIVLAAAVAGMVLGLTLAFLFEYFDDRIRTPEQLGEATGARVWGLLPKPTDAPMLGRLKAGVTSLTDQRTAESFRQLGVQLLPNSTTNLGSVLVSNFEPGDAAARIASNLAITLARAGKRVLLIDGDLQQPVLGELFELGDRKGLADWLGDSATQPNIVSIDWMPGLSVLPVGPSDDNSVPEMVWTRMDTLLKTMQMQNDLIVVAGPPLTTSADSVFFAEHVDGVLAVAQCNHTSRQKARQAIENLRALGVQILGVVLAMAGAPRLNAVTMPAHHEMPAPSSTPLISGERSFAIESPKPDKGAAFGAILASKTDASKTTRTGVDKTQI